MSILNYLKLQPVDPQNDGTTSDLDEYAQDETIDLKHDISEQELDASWDKVLKDFQQDSDELNYSDSDK